MYAEPDVAQLNPSERDFYGAWLGLVVIAAPSKALQNASIVDHPCRMRVLVIPSGDEQCIESGNMHYSVGQGVFPLHQDKLKTYAILMFASGLDSVESLCETQLELRTSGLKIG